MAFFDDSLLLNGQAKLIAGFQNGELKYNAPVVTTTLQGYQNICTPDWQTLKLASDRAFQLDFFKRTSRALTTGKSYTHTYTHGASGKISPTFDILSDGFRISKKQATRSTRTIEEMYNNEFVNTVLNMTKGIEDKAVDYILAGRDTINTANIKGTFNATNDVFEIAEANINSLFQIALTRMDVIGYSGMALDVFCDSITYMLFRTQMAQGGGNSTNLQYQFTDGNITFHHVPSLLGKQNTLFTNAYAKGSFLIIPAGTVTILDWVSELNRKGDTSKVANFGVVLNPVNNIILGTHEIELGADTTTQGGDTQDVVKDTQLSTEISLVKAPYSTSGESSIFAYGIV
jgi:hypothetical protein